MSMNPPQSDEKVKKSRLKWYEQLGLFFLFSLCGILALGPIQWGNITLPDPWIYPYKIVLPFVFLLISLVLRRKTNLEPYFKIFFMFFTATSALLIVKLVFLLINSLDAFFTIPTNTEWGFSTVKFIEMFVIVSSVILINLIAQRTEHKRKIFEELYMKKGKLYLGLIIGFSGFFVFAIGAVFIAKYLFYGSALTWSAVFTWLPWILLFCFSNGILEEVLYRGLFLTRYEPFFNFHVYNLLQAIIFASIHIGVIYTSESLMFLGITFLLGLLFGLLTKKTDSLLASILFHAGTDFVVIIGIFVNL